MRWRGQTPQEKWPVHCGRFCFMHLKCVWVLSSFDQQTAQMLKKPDHGLVSLDSAGTLLSLAKTTLGACGTTESLSLQHVRGGVAGARRALHTRKTHQDPESANETRPGLLWP